MDVITALLDSQHGRKDKKDLWLQQTLNTPRVRLFTTSNLSNNLQYKHSLFGPIFTILPSPEIDIIVDAKYGVASILRSSAQSSTQRGPSKPLSWHTQANTIAFSEKVPGLDRSMNSRSCWWFSAQGMELSCWDWRVGYRRQLRVVFDRYNRGGIERSSEGRRTGRGAHSNELRLKERLAVVSYLSLWFDRRGWWPRRLYVCQRNVGGPHRHLYFRESKQQNRKYGELELCSAIEEEPYPRLCNILIRNSVSGSCELRTQSKPE